MGSNGEIVRIGELDLPGLPPLRFSPVVVTTLTVAQMKHLLTEFGQYAEMFSIVLVKENGKGYNAVLHNGGTNPKLRLALVSATGNIESSLLVRDLVEAVYSGGAFPPHIQIVVDRVLQNLNGSVMLKVVCDHDTKTFRVTDAIWHRGNIWP